MSLLLNRLVQNTGHKSTLPNVSGPQNAGPQVNGPQVTDTQVTGNRFLHVSQEEKIK